MAISHSQKASSFLSRLLDFDAPEKGTSVVYTAVRPQVELMCRVWLSLPGNGNPLAADDPSQALTDLIGFGAINGPEDMVAAVEAISKAFSIYLTDERKSFVSLVGSDTITTSDVTKLFQTRRDDEVREQNDLLTRANDLKSKMTDAASKLAIPMIAVPSAPPAKEPKKKINLFKVLLYVEDPVVKKTNVASAPSSWLLPPVLDEKSSDDVAKLLRIWDFIFARKLEADVVKGALRDNYGLGDDELKVLFARVQDVVTRQIAQSQMILTAIDKDFKLYQGCLTAALELQLMLVDVGKFFGFQVGKSASSSVKTSKQ